jgi:hypothetical protein
MRAARSARLAEPSSGQESAHPMSDSATGMTQRMPAAFERGGGERLRKLDQ